MYCSALLGPDADQIPDIITSYGLRTVDGECNNLKIDVGVGDTSGQTAGAADVPFPRLTDADVPSRQKPITAGLCRSGATGTDQAMPRRRASSSTHSLA